jgi:hypothetical protein
MDGYGGRRPPGNRSIGPGQGRAVAAAARCWANPRGRPPAFVSSTSCARRWRTSTGATRRREAPVFPVFPTGQAKKPSSLGCDRLRGLARN